MPSPVDYEEAFMRWINGESFAEIGREFGITKQAVQAWARDHGWYERKELILHQLRDQINTKVEELILKRVQIADKLIHQLNELAERKFPAPETLSELTKAIKDLSDVISRLTADLPVQDKAEPAVAGIPADLLQEIQEIEEAEEAEASINVNQA